MHSRSKRKNSKNDCVHYMFVIWLHGTDTLEESLQHFSSLFNHHIHHESRGEFKFKIPKCTSRPNVKRNIYIAIQNTYSHGKIYLQYHLNPSISTNKVIQRVMTIRAKLIYSDKYILRNELQHITVTMS